MVDASNGWSQMSGSEMTEARETDKALVVSMLAGEAEAFDLFFDSHFPRLFRFALTRLNGNEDAAEEAAQATLCKAVAKLDTYRGEAALFTWLCTFCRHELSAHYKKRNRDERLRDLVEDSPEIRAALDSLDSAVEDPEAIFASGETSRLVQVTLDHLPSRYGDALEWKYILGLSVNEIASRMELGPKAVESLLTRARRAFRDGFTALTREVST